LSHFLDVRLIRSSWRLTTAALFLVACSANPANPDRGSDGEGGAGEAGGAGGTAKGGRGGGGGRTNAGGVSGQGGAGGADSAGGAGGSDTSGVPDASAAAEAGAPDTAAEPGRDGGTLDPSGSEAYVATALSPGTGQRTDRRPMPVGFYDASVNKTFVSWMGPGSNALVKAYDHATATWSPDKVVGKSPDVDSHNYPTMIRGKDNRLYIFYGCHNTPLRMAVSPDPLSIDGTWKDGNVAAAPDASYPAPLITSDGTMYVFIRLTRQKNGHTDDRPFALIKSTDNGQTWTRQLIIDPYPRADNLTEIYNGKISYQPARGDVKARIHIAWTLAGGGPGKHEHDAFTRNIYYAYLDPATDHLYDIGGRDLGTTIDDAEAEMSCKALDTGCSNCAHQTGYQISVSYNDDSSPLILFGHYMNGLTAVRRQAAGWATKVVATDTGEPRDINRIGPGAFQAFRSAGNTCVVHRTTDGGETWRLETTITAPHPVGRCHVIDNHHPDVKLFMEQNTIGGGTSTAKVTSGFAPHY
jgi:hypothetical protein